MTYCVAISVNDGLVLCSDSRTNAGPDMISTHSKMHTFKPGPGRLFTILTAGNLATTQAIISRIEHDLEDPDAKTNLRTVTRMVEAARYVSRVNREEQAHAQASTVNAGVDTSASLILGGQIAGAEPSIYLLYAAGNFITDSDENPFLQIGESKYGKPILDRILTRETTLGDATRCVLVSMDSTIKSNATVGPPIEMLIYPKDSFDSDHFVRLGEDDHYLHEIRQRWNEALKLAFAELPQFEWEKRGHRSPSNVLSISPDVQK